MLITAEQIANLPQERKTHFMNPQAVRLDQSLGDAAGLKNLGVHRISIEPGHYSTEPHTHHYEEECLLIQQGTGEALLGDARSPVGPGDFLAYPTHGPAHSLYNSGTEPLVCLVVGQRLPFDITDYPNQGKRFFRHDGNKSLVDQSDIRKL
ncbi:MAG: cupin domain-containing protein [Saccharospirillum sp.]